LFVSSLFALLGRSSSPSLASVDIRPISYSPVDATGSPSSSMARTKRTRMACYPVGGECTQNVQCCTGFCRSGLQAAYCDNP
jgi:hypothetical protein